MALRKQTPAKSVRRHRLGYGVMDLFVVTACGLTFAAVVGPSMHAAPKGPPIALIARDLGTTPEQFQQVADRFMPRRPHGPPTEAQKKQVATTLNVSVERLDTVMEKYRPDRLRQQ
jgi:hypothetical protein